MEKDWGIKVAKHEDKLGLRGSPTGEIVLDEVRVPASHLIGEEGQGFRIAMHTLDRSRPGIGAQAVGIAQACVDYAGEYMKERKAFGSPIANLQGLRFMLADMAIRTEAARALVYRACSIIDAGRPERRALLLRCRGEVLRLGHRDVVSPSTPSSSSVATATPRTSPSSASSAMRRSPRSTRGPTRFSGS